MSNAGRPMADAVHSFNDSAAYERFIGEWGRAAGAIFLDWLAPPTDAVWLDVGCGTGLFTELILNSRAPAAVLAIDPSDAQIQYARSKPVARLASFARGDAQALEFADATFDVVAAALVINFIPDRLRALAEMRRVARAGGMVAGYVWDFAAEMSPSGPFRRTMGQLVAAMPALPGTAESSLGALRSLFERAGFEDIATCSIDVTVSFPDFESFWRAQTPSYSPTTKMIGDMTAAERARLTEAMRGRLALSPDGSIQYPARANAVKARAPGRLDPMG